MKKVLVVILALVLALGIALPVSANPLTSISKTMAPDPANLGDHVLVTIDVHTNASDTSVTVQDWLPPELTLIPATVSVPVGCTVTSTSDHYLSVSLPSGAEADYTITFNAQVTSVEATAYDVTNDARLRYYYSAAWHQIDVDYSIELLPYAGFEKIFDIEYEGNTNGAVEVNELVQWDMTITVPNNFAWPINNAVLKDNLGGELGMAGDGVNNDRVGGIDDGVVPPADLPKSYNTIPAGNNGTGGLSDLMIKTKGKTKKVQFWVVDIDIAASGSLNYVLGVFTDRNPSRWGQQCYTWPDTYDLNSGATLKFTDPTPIAEGGTGFQLSAHTPSIPVTVVP